MIDINELYITNYCHPSCEPFMNICRLPKEEAFLLAQKMAHNNTDTTAFGRFADFDNYYPLRIEQDDILYNLFISLGGKPKEKHPLSFVLQNSGYLHSWFGNGIINKIKLKHIPSEFISFTLGDSMAAYKRDGKLTMYTKEMLSDILTEYSGTVEEFINEAAEKYYYIEVQLWNDDFVHQHAYSAK